MCTYLEWNSVASFRNPRPGWESTTSWIRITKSSGTRYALPLLAPELNLLLFVLLLLKWLLLLLFIPKLEGLNCICCLVDDVFECGKSEVVFDKYENVLRGVVSELSVIGDEKFEVISAAFVTT